jgi:hypothetical protein
LKLQFRPLADKGGPDFRITAADLAAQHDRFEYGTASPSI